MNKKPAMDRKTHGGIDPIEQKFALAACFELVQLAPFTQKNRVLPLMSALTHKWFRK
jgi:hypothetical protein